MCRKSVEKKLLTPKRPPAIICLGAGRDNILPTGPVGFSDDRLRAIVLRAIEWRTTPGSVTHMRFSVT